MSIKKGVGILSLCTFLLLGLSLFAQTEVKTGENVVVTNTESGKVRGYIHNGIYIYKSIPYAQKTSLAGGSALEDFTNHTYKNKTVTANNTTDMKTVEIQFEDSAKDMIAYVDSERNSYNFAFGLNWNGIIADNKVAVHIGSGY